MTIAIMTIDKWLPKREPSKKNQSPLKRLSIVFTLFVISILVLNVFHVFGLQILLKTSGFVSPTDVLKLLLP